MATNVKNYDEVKLFKIVHLNLHGKVKEWYKCLELAPANWATLKAHGCNYIMINWRNCLQGEFFLSGTKEEVSIKIKAKNQEVMHCVGLCQHGSFIGSYFGGGKSSWGIKGNTI